jgi:hypothetical protein
MLNSSNETEATMNNTVTINGTTLQQRLKQRRLRIKETQKMLRMAQNDEERNAIQAYLDEL